MSDNIPGSISIKNVSKVFKKASGGSASYSTIKSFLVQNLFRSKKTSKTNLPTQKYKALDSISLDLAPGSSTALIGRNGSGKSTILKLIAGIYTPDTGSVAVNGKVSALIELGAGFHPDFTGRENVFLGGIMFGLSKKEIKKRFDDIVSYAELSEVIDEPVRTYSSGMYMRLGFSLAIHTDPDILLIDEVLAVGDAHFIHRCQDSISDFKRRGKTLVFVTHDLNSVSKWCDEAVWLEHGKIKLKGHPRQITDAYLSSISKKEEHELEINEPTLDKSEGQQKNDPSSEDNKRWGDRKVEITRVQLKDKNSKAKWIYSKEDALQIVIDYKVNERLNDIVFGVGLIRIDGLELFGTNTAMNDQIQKHLDQQIENSKNYSLPLQGQIIFNIERLGLIEGSYFVDVASHAEDGRPYDYLHRMYKFQIRDNQGSAVGVIHPATSWDISKIESLDNNLKLNVGEKAC